MGKAALTTVLEDILKETERYREGVVDTFEHVYPVDDKKIADQVKKAIAAIDPKINTNSIVLREVRTYTKELYDRFKRLEASSRVKTVKYTVVGSPNSFVVVCKSVPGMENDVFSKINDVRTGSLGKESFRQPKNWSTLPREEQDRLRRQFDKISSASPLSNLRRRLLLILFQVELDKVDTKQESKQLDVILGAKQFSKESGEFIGRRGGLLHLGHLDGFAVIERRAAAIVSKLKEKTGIEIGKATISKSIRNRRKFKLHGDFAEIVLNLDIDANTTIVTDEFAGVNIAKVFEKNILPQLRKAFLNRKNWHKYPGSITIENAVIDDGTQDLTDKIQAQFGKAAKITRRRNTEKRGSSKSTEKPIKVTGTKTKTRGEGENFYSSASTGGAVRSMAQQSNAAPTYNWSSLLAILNAKLPPKVIANMRYPALVNRTGTFANSTEVVNIETSREGYPVFVFDYERDPYNVFDRTLGRAPWNTPERDPRALVDKSVREIVREMAIGRFYTKRRT